MNDSDRIAREIAERSELLARLRVKVDEALAPHVEIYGHDSPVVRMGLRILAEAEAIEAEIQGQRVSTEQASDVKGWHVETLHGYARRKLAGERLAAPWDAIQVEKTPAGYVWVIGTIPENPSRRVA